MLKALEIYFYFKLHESMSLTALPGPHQNVPKQREWLYLKICGLRCHSLWLTWVDLQRVNAGICKMWEKSCKKCGGDDFKTTHKAESTFTSSTKKLILLSRKLSFFSPWISPVSWFPSKQTFSRVLTVSTGTCRIFSGSVFNTVDWMFPRSVCSRQCGLRAFNSIILFIFTSVTKIDACTWSTKSVMPAMTWFDFSIFVSGTKRQSSAKKSCKQWKRRRIKLERICLKITQLGKVLLKSFCNLVKVLSSSSESLNVIYN